MSVPSLIRPGDHASRQARAFAWGAAALVACFGAVLVRLGRFAIESEFNSYILLVPAIAAGLAWARPRERDTGSEPNRGLALALFAPGILALALYWAAAGRYRPWTADRLTLASLSFVLLFAALAAWCLGRRTFGSFAFPFSFLICMVPLPTGVTSLLEAFLQHASAAAANVLFQLSDLPVFRRDDLTFQIPGVTLEVAPECSGIQSTVALMVVSLAAGYLFLRSPWKRAAIALVVIPLGILRNAFRIFTIAELCAHYGPQMIDSYIHRKGGWIFFLILLAPFLGIVMLLARSERETSAETIPTQGVPCRK